MFKNLFKKRKKSIIEQITPVIKSYLKLVEKSNNTNNINDQKKYRLDALNQLNNVINRYPDPREVKEYFEYNIELYYLYLFRGILYNVLGEYEKAKIDLELIPLDDPKFINFGKILWMKPFSNLKYTISKNYGVSEFGLGNYDVAVDHILNGIFDKNLKSILENINIRYLAEGYLAILTDMKEKAIEYFKNIDITNIDDKILQKFDIDNKSTFYIILSNLSLYVGKIEESLKYCKRALELNPKNKTAKNLLKNIEKLAHMPQKPHIKTVFEIETEKIAKKKEQEEIIKRQNLEELLIKNPNTFRLHLDAARLYRPATPMTYWTKKMREDAIKAEEEYNKVLELYPSCLEAKLELSMLLTAYNMEGMNEKAYAHKKAEMLLKELIYGDQNLSVQEYETAFQTLGLLYRNRKRYDEAENILRNSLKRMPDSKMLLFYLGLTLFNLQKEVEASDIFKRIFPEYKNMLHKIDLSRTQDFYTKKVTDVSLVLVDKQKNQVIRRENLKSINWIS